MANCHKHGDYLDTYGGCPVCDGRKAKAAKIKPREYVPRELDAKLREHPPAMSDVFDREYESEAHPDA